MTAYSHNSAIHRTIRLSAESRGADVKRLQDAANARLHARGQDSYKITVDGEFGPLSARACSRAVFLLGANGTTVHDSQKDHGGILHTGAQKMIRVPGTRSAAQLAAGEKRMNALEQAAHSADVAAQKRRAIVDLALTAARLALAHAPSVHYTQTAARWDGIARHLLAADGGYPRYADCSSFYTWCMWQGMRAMADTVNGQAWHAGYTGTLLTHGELVQGTPKAGDAAIYGHGWPGSHVAICLGDGTVISHGSEGGPYHLALRYRSDLYQVRRYV